MKSLLVLLLMITSTITFAGERNELKITGIDDASTITVKDGCSMKVERRFWFDDEKKVDCHGLILKKVVGTNIMEKEIEIESVLIFPIKDLQDAKDITEAIKYQMNGDIPSGLTLDLSSLRYYSEPLKLSDFTTDERDNLEVILGGITLRYKLVKEFSSNKTYTRNRTINAGLN
ncbi:hypothetical protein HBN50_13560 [Halobacteriovorax sp. GB3]|uniref:hypothetical protein n=1 Tax=Halobacteriovorax sp. GB3 TaxID=2719615 RepID=UPI0023601541|nr:hypothetical protein [Halobacteriovorax sp. GB3]MDD0854134.1 hypothetical protein [Halobacteriovorax sp. GB3]